MQFLFLGNPTAAVQANAPTNIMDVVRGDWAKASEYYTQGIFRQMWTAGKGFVAICEADSQAHLQGLLAELPMAKAGYIDMEIRELAGYRGFSSAAMQPKAD